MICAACSGDSYDNVDCWCIRRDDDDDFNDDHDDDHGHLPGLRLALSVSDDQLPGPGVLLASSTWHKNNYDNDEG